VNNWKSKLVRVFCCLNGPDALCLLQSNVAQPVIKCPSKTIYEAIFMLCRVVGIVFKGYLISLKISGDLTILPLLAILCGLSIILARFGMSETASKIVTYFRSGK